MTNKQKRQLNYKRQKSTIKAICILLTIFLLGFTYKKRLEDKKLTKNEYLENINSEDYPMLHFYKEYDYKRILEDFRITTDNDYITTEEQVKFLESIGLKVSYIDKKDIVVHDENLTDKFILTVYDAK